MKTLRNRTGRILGVAAAGVLLALGHGTAPAGDVLLQYFEGKWETIERRMPDVFMAGYTGIWVPPPGIADSGGFSVGYDVFDRFNFGSPDRRTLYGTTEGFAAMGKQTDRAGISLFVDTVLNHNGFSDLGRPNFVNEGDYPGFVLTLPNDVDGDFHGSFEGGDLNGRLAGLIDIAQEKNHVFTRHPVPGQPNNIPNETPLESNRRFYPDRDLPAQFGRHPFNTANPLAGDPVQENATGLLTRYVQWLVEVNGVDGFRLDATKHMPTWFFNNFYDAAIYNVARNPINGEPYTPFSFGENFDGDFGRLAAYVRKDGYGNRDTLDFPLFFAMDSVMGAGGFGDMRQLENSAFDGNDGNANDGTLGVMYAGSHDQYGAGAGNGYNNLAQAHILTRTGYPLVYYNAKEFGDGRDFPKDGRGDALGNFGSVITTLVGINREYGRNYHQTRWIDGDVYIYERFNSMIVGLNDRGDAGYDERTVATGFAAGTVLVELTGNARNAFIDPSDQIFDTVRVNDNGTATIRVPRMRSASGFHAQGYVIYGPAAPESTIAITNATGTIGPDPDDGRPQGTRRLATLQVVKDNRIDVRLTVAQTETVQNDNSLIKINYGELDIDGDGNRNPYGEFAGFESFPSVTTNGNNKIYTASINANTLKEGYNYIETVAFRQRPANSPPVMDRQRTVVYLDREPPTQNLVFPARTGNRDITSSDYEAVIQVDHTVNSVHVLRNVPAGASDQDIIALLGANSEAYRRDRGEFRRLLTGLTAGTLELTVVAFEETGNYKITRYGGIGVEVGVPELAIGVDYDTSAGSVNFQPVPSTTDSLAFPQEFVVRVKTRDIDEAGRDIAFGTDYTVNLSVDGGPPIEAVAYDATLLPPVGRLVQNDQNLGGDAFEEFRFVWREYGPGQHTFVATATLLGTTPQVNSVQANISVEGDIPGPSVTITNPAPPGATLNNPSSVTVAGTFNDNLAKSARVFLNMDTSVLLGEIATPAQGPFSVTKQVGSYVLADVIPANSIALRNGVFPVRVVASTGANGTGVSSETTSQLTITGVTDLPRLAAMAIDGNADDTLAAPVLAVSPADGGTGTGATADFGADGSLTELRAMIRDGVLYIAVRGDMFGATETNTDNATFVLVDVNAGSGQGATNLRDQLNDTSDGLRTDISNAAFVLGSGLNGVGIDLIVGVTAPNIGYAYSLGTDGLEGSFTSFAFRPEVSVAYDDSADNMPAAPGTTIAGPDAFEVAIPLAAIGNPDLSKIRIAAVSASDAGYASPNTLPENAGNGFGENPNTQTLDTMASLPASAGIVINEVATGAVDWVELYNPTANTVDLAGWSLRFQDSDPVTADYVFPAGATLAAGAYLVVADQSVQGIGNLRTTGFNIPWDTTRGGGVGLVDPIGIGRDYVSWRDASGREGTDPARPSFGTTYTGNVSGPTAAQSLGRNSNSTDTNAAADWENTGGANASAPTPGARNIGGFSAGADRFRIF